MEQSEFYRKCHSRISGELAFLPDKPEENVDNTLRALWFAAAGDPKSAQAAEDGELPVLDAENMSKLEEYLNRRLSGVPLAHITGRQQFMGVELIAGPGALVPRKETEILGQSAVSIIKDRAGRQETVQVMDVCTGAGNLPVAYALSGDNVKAYAADLASEAVSLARENVKFHNLEDRVEVREGDLLAPFDSPEFYNSMDLLSCNPPYISSGKVDTMDKEISAHEPRLAFDGGPFGIKILNRLIKEAPKYLKEGGFLVFEVGEGQGDSISQRLKKTGFYSTVECLYDSDGNIRSLMAQK
ncbi:MAG: peptide chain release factor N(5)-glutamine methyltransferase [Gammaproteobacteria bacterium]|nr:peptide chain release factor N(5)-glutamine methyltransferase [Gammaproteobacteria bacterium]MDH5799218.1 peptide chain release factor N(5)-glutamine methyltransferase [Gammaproteobacteria bacterium]